MKNIPSRCDWFLNSPARCHVVGVVTSLALLLATIWIWASADVFGADDRYTSEQIDKAIRLVSDADNLRVKQAAELEIFEQNKQRISNIRRWLPAEPTWEQTNHRIREIAKRANVKLASVDEGERHVLSRVGVRKVVCQIEGSYADICRLLHELALDQKPIWCDSIRIQRTPPGPASQFECSALISMRVPFVTDGTVAAKLLQSGAPHAG